MLPGIADALQTDDRMMCRVGDIEYLYANGLLTFRSPRGAQVEVALLVDNLLVEVNDVVVASDITHSDQVEHERLREMVENAFHVLNGLAAGVEHQREEARRAGEEAVRRALDSL